MEKRAIIWQVIGLILIFIGMVLSSIIINIQDKNINELKQQIETNNLKIEELNTIIKDKDKNIEELNKKIEENKTKTVATTTPTLTSYRLTSYWANDGYQTGSCTGTGLCEKDFQVNDKGWYTYQGKLVMATATPYLLKYGYAKRDGIKYYKYYDTLTVSINNVDYEAIILDSCGACMKKNILDLFVSNKQSAITTNNIKVK